MPLLGGIRPPIAVLLVLVLAVAGITAAVLGRAGEPSVPEGVLSSQQHFAEDGAVALRASIDERVTDLRRTAAGLNAGDPVEPERILSDLGKTYQKWTGTGVIDLRSGKVLAARGETIPLGWLDKEVLTGEHALVPRMVRLESGDVRLMSMAVLDGEDGAQQLLVASNSIAVPSINLGPFRSMAVVASDGEILSTAGFERPESVNSDAEREELDFLQKQMSGMADLAAAEAEKDPVSSKEPGSHGYTGVSGRLLGDEYNGRVVTAGYASLASSDPEQKQSVGAGLGLTVVAMLPVVQEEASAQDHGVYGLLAAGALVALGLVAVAVLWGTIQRPLIGLFLESRRLARGDLARPVAVPRWGETARVGAALERVRTQLGGGPAPDADGRTRPAGRIGVRVPLALTAVLLLLWCVPVGLLLNRTDDSVSVPAALVNDQRDRTDLLSDRVRRALNEAHADVVSTARLIGGREDSGPAALEALLKDAMRDHPRYESLYVADGDGKVVAHAGDEPAAPWSTAKRLPPLRVTGEGGSTPVVQAGSAVPGDAGLTLVGEVRVQFLGSLLDRPGLGTVRVVDADGRTLASNRGFLAFAELPEKSLTDLVRAGNLQVGAGPVENGLLLREGGSVTVAAAAPFSGGGVASDIGWSVVSWQDADRLQTVPSQREDRSVLAGILGLAAIVVCLGWLHLVVARPLRDLAAAAERLADGDHKSVLYPRYHDEVGAVVRSLELLRQQLQTLRRNEALRQAAAASQPSTRGM
ncbi:PDC sensor domain-containing protein [Streptomyces fragilis]|uniref:HAMP domain-containing protein n=1 Tax=Streptomyces fragilis TaxID=67301 RepID=A0ABV2YJQ7_9ACTN|nr:HAMP domain-containing protein [Streptomyces fragilis]